VLAAKYEALLSKEDSLKSALKVRRVRGEHLNAMAAFWSVVNDEEAAEGNKAMMLKTKMASQMEIQKAKSDLLLLQGLSMTTGSTKCTSSDH